MSSTLRWVLDLVLLLSGAVWVGGLIAIAVVARVARRTLEEATRVTFFRALGRAYGIVGALALLLALTAGAVLLAGHGWDAKVLGVVVVAAVLLITTAVGVRQARALTRLRQHALIAPTDAQLARRLRNATRRAALLRGGIAVLSVALVGLAAAFAG